MTALLSVAIAAHLLLRAVHRTTVADHLAVDDLARDEARPTGTVDGEGEAAEG